MWRYALKQNCESFQELLTVRIVIDFMKDDIENVHIEKLDSITDDWEKIEYLIKSVLIPGTTKLLESFKQVICSL